LYVNDRSRLAHARQMLVQAIKISSQPVQAPKLIVAEVPGA
jgi:hypothetical protein